MANKVADDADEDAYVGPDLVEQSARTMERVVEGMGGEGKLLILSGPPQITFVQLQQTGWDQVLAENPGIEVVDGGGAGPLDLGAVDATTAALSANPDVTGILASIDDMALGAVQAAGSAGIAPEDIFVAGWDGGPAAVEAIKAGDYDLTLSQKPYTWGQIAVETAVDWLNEDEPSEHRVNTPDVFIDQENVNTLTEKESADAPVRGRHRGGPGPSPTGPSLRTSSSVLIENWLQRARPRRAGVAHAARRAAHRPCLPGATLDESEGTTHRGR